MSIKWCIKCGSYAFNLYKDGIDQGCLCDVHYWQGRAHRAEAKQLPPFGKLLLWDAEDPESTGGPWHDIVGALEGIGGNRDLNVGDEVTLMRAIEQPSYTLRITSIPGKDSDSFERVGYELVGPAEKTKTEETS